MEAPSSWHGTFEMAVDLPHSREEAFAWHVRAGAFERLIAPFDRVELLDGHGPLEAGKRMTIRVKQGPISLRWVAEIAQLEPGRLFRDVQLSGPFKAWDHTHQALDLDEGNCRFEDRVHYRFRGGWLGRLLAGRMLARQLPVLFRYRHRTLKDDLRSHAAARDLGTMKILVSGSTGLVGQSLVPFLTTGGHEVARLARAGATEASSTGHPAVSWNPSTGEVSSGSLDGFDAVVHLAGASIADGRWTDARKKVLLDSRVEGTRNLCEALASAENKPKVLVCASAIGYYGDRGDEVLTEGAPRGDGFLPEVCQAWEDATAPARNAGIRVVNMRIGIVLSPKGGALKKMLTPFKMGVGGKMGSGTQAMSWVAIDDLVGMIHFAVTNEGLSGPVNAVAPKAMSNLEFTKTLGGVIKRPTVFPAPAFAVRLALGEMADELLLASTNVKPAALQAAGYEFRFSELEPALRHVLGR